MKRFKEMIEQVKKQKAIAFPSTEVSEDKKSIFRNPTKYYDTGMFFHFAEHCIPFVFSRSGNGPTEIPDEDYKGVELDAPFKIFSIEVLGGSITVPDNKEDLINLIKSGDTSFLQNQVSIECIMVVEESPKEFLSFGLMTTNGVKSVVIMKHLNVVAHQFIKRLRYEQSGIEEVRERIKVGSGKAKRTLTIRKIVHVRPKKLVTLKSDTGKDIDWSHRWPIRGHWRKMAGLGKNREGNYCIENMTWVVDHVKGPEGAPIIKKTYVVQAKLNSCHDYGMIES